MDVALSVSATILAVVALVLAWHGGNHDAAAVSASVAAIVATIRRIRAGRTTKPPDIGTFILAAFLASPALLGGGCAHAPARVHVDPSCLVRASLGCVAAVSACVRHTPTTEAPADDTATEQSPAD